MDNNQPSTNFNYYRWIIPFFGIMFTTIVVLLFIRFIPYSDPGNFILALDFWVGLIGFILGYIIDDYRRGEHKKKGAEEQQMELIQEAITKHIKVLSSKRSALIIFNEYGGKDDSEWKKEIQVFINSALLKSLEDFCDAYKIPDSTIIGIIDHAVEVQQQEHDINGVNGRKET